MTCSKSFGGPIDYHDLFQNTTFDTCIKEPMTKVAYWTNSAYITGTIPFLDHLDECSLAFMYWPLNKGNKVTKYPCE